ncbi:MAG: type IV toxin-antitoxin system AbiEi family antitoxin domain-containing protein [Longimicrobiales bacterium]
MATSSPDGVILALAERQHGVVSRRQLLRAGLTGPTVRHRLRTGRLRRIHRGVYLSGSVPGRYHREMAAILACGDKAVVSHTTAARLWELLSSQTSRRSIEVSVPYHIRGPSAGVRIHRVAPLPPDEVGRRHQLPVTRPARTLLDLAAVVRPAELERMMGRGERLGVFRPRDATRLLRRYPSRTGTPALRAVLGIANGPAFLRSEAEAQFLALIRTGGIAKPETNVVVEGLEVDALWRRNRVVVEIDGFTYHGHRVAFERDRHRDAKLHAAGYRVLRFTWRQITEESGVVLVRLASALAVNRAPTG